MKITLGKVIANFTDWFRYVWVFLLALFNY